nr:unnamed protein product [Callosobruchus analis]
MDENRIIKICHLNVRSLIGHFADFSDLIQSSSYDIVAISEAWLNGNVDGTAVQINNYNFERRDRNDGSRGGGVGIYIKNYIKYKILDEGDSTEDIWVKLLFNKLPLCDKFICLGDFNIDLLNSTHATNLFSNLLDSSGLIQVIKEPTRVTKNSATLLDFILISDNISISKVGSVPCYHISDHELVYVDVSVSRNKAVNNMKTYRDIKNMNLSVLYDELQSIPWRNVYDIDNIDGKVEFFNENITILMDRHAPLRTCNFTKPHKPWITSNIKMLIKLQDKALVKFKRTRSAADWERYKELKNHITFLIRSEKKAYLHVTNKDKTFVWKSLSNLKIIRKDISSIPQYMKNVSDINNYFINAISSSDSSNEKLGCYEGICSNITSFLNFRTATEVQIADILFNIKSTAIGDDGIHINFLIACCPFILKFLAHIINFCIQNSTFPAAWKVGKIIPIPKSKSVESYSDIRPITILPVISKILGRIIKLQLVNHVENNNILPETQSGFRPHHSCATSLLNVTDNILRATDQGKCTLLVLLDFSKAFDTLNHSILLHILKHIGLVDSAVTFLKSYLNNRKQKVVLDGKESSTLDVVSGVPQGSVLGPLLYTIYTSKLVTAIRNCQYQMYADDTQLMYSFFPDDMNSACLKVNEDLSSLYNMSLKQSLHLNPNKSVVMLFGRKKDRERICGDVHITVNNCDISLKHEAKNLGLIFDTAMRFDKHVSACIQKAIFKLKSIYPHRHYLNRDLRRMLCDSTILSTFNYCDVVYGPCLTAANAQRIQRVQNCCLRFIYGIRRRQPISHKLKDCKWLNMQQRRKLHCMNLYYRIIQVKKPAYLYLKITFRTDVHMLNLRFKGRLTPPVHKTSCFERSFSYCIAKAFNGLPPLLLSCSVFTFNKKYKLFLMDL